MSKPSLTKYAALLDDLVSLRNLEPSFRAVIFTRFDTVQQRLVRILKDESTAPTGKLYFSNPPEGAAPSGKSKAVPKATERLKIYEFNRQTAPTARHRRISEFQNSTASNPRVFVVTYATA